MHYRLIGIDLDGTLLDRRGRLSAANRAAIARAQAAGVLVVPCTGRAWRESLTVLTDFPNPTKGIFASGAAVADIPTGKAIDIAVLEPHLAMDLVRRLEPRRQAVLVLREQNITGHDYLVTGQGSLSPSTEWWFQVFGAVACFKRQITLEDLHHTLRVGMVGPAGEMREVADDVLAAVGAQVVVQSFEAVKDQSGTSVHVLEIFARDVHKWRGLSWLATQMGVTAGEVAVIGDEVNDIAAMQSAGCGIAMGNAIEPVKQVARYVTHDCDHDGVAYAIGQLLEGIW
ncbi:MAG: HAD hydrolase family protein [Phycisphaeraceae bacterium]